MAFGSKGRTGNRRPSQGNALFKRKKFCRFTAAHVAVSYTHLTLPTICSV